MTAGRCLEDKVALVTGAARGIGKAIAEKLGAAGALVVIADVTDGAPETEKAVKDAGGRSAFIKLDVSDFDAVADACKKIERGCGGLHVLVNNAGVTRDQLAVRLKAEDFQRVIEINLGGTFNACRAAARIMVREGEGRIVNLSSIVASIGRPGQVNYAASKAGIEGLTRSLALELGYKGITVNAVAPGYIDTEMTRALPAEVQKEILGRVPLGRAGTAAEVADLVSFLVSPAAGYITGQVFHINGGLYFG